jgi:hypothetical protein
VIGSGNAVADRERKTGKQQGMGGGTQPPVNTAANAKTGVLMT